MNIDKIVELAQASQSMTSRRIVRPAMTPIILVCMLSPCCFVAAYLMKDDTFLSRLLGVMGVLPILVACGMFVYFGVFKTDKLQSEDYQIKQEVLQLILNKGGKIKVEPISVEKLTEENKRLGEARE